MTTFSWRRMAALFAGALIVALVLVSCGGGGEEPTPAPTQVPTRAPTAAPAATPTAAPTARPTVAPTATPVPPPTATPTPAAPRPKTGGIFTMRVSGAFANEWDNYTAAGRNAVIVTQNLLNNITHIDPLDGSTIRPDLAESWSFSPDGTVLTYKLRQGVRWHDGAPMTSRDIVASMERARNPTDPAAGVHRARLAIIASIEAPDALTVRVTLKKPSASFLTGASAPELTIYPVHVPDIKAWKASPLGTGPFSFKSFQANTQSELVKNNSYFKKDASGTALPYLDGVTHVWITDQALAFSAFRTGRLSCACGYSSDIEDTQREQAASAIPGVKFGSAFNMNVLQLNASRPPLDNLKVRQAIHIGFDRRQMTAIFRGGRGAYPPTYFVPQSRGGKWSLPTDEVLKIPGFREPKQQDLDLAKRLFQEAGVDPTKLVLTVTTATTVGDEAEGIASMLLQLGIKTTVDAIASSVDLAAKLMRGDFFLTFTGGGNSLDDPADQVTNRVITGGGLNYGKFSSARVDKLLADQDAELDPAKRRALIYDLQRELLDQAAYVPINTFPILYAAQPYVEGLTIDRAFSIGAHHRLENVWLNR